MADLCTGLRSILRLSQHVRGGIGAELVASGSGHPGSAERGFRNSDDIGFFINIFRRKGALQTIIDLLLAVSSVIVGVALVVLWGSCGALGFVEKGLELTIIFGLSGIVLASVFITLPFVVREVEPMLH